MKPNRLYFPVSHFAKDTFAQELEPLLCHTRCSWHLHKSNRVRFYVDNRCVSSHSLPISLADTTQATTIISNRLTKRL